MEEGHRRVLFLVKVTSTLAQRTPPKVFGVHLKYEQALSCRICAAPAPLCARVATESSWGMQAPCTPSNGCCPTRHCSLCMSSLGGPLFFAVQFFRHSVLAVALFCHSSREEFRQGLFEGLIYLEQKFRPIELM
eukprot:TRINITY_DN743_c0_g3_i1.p1 TRINITY_DN743_c0_g3~~TRINITY_DN743_c0_g3_i1.p1  ORF type:complete len:134 (+),score=1.86 TRINITY_DN743_c0_g3_i1:1037-1438(+)